MATAVSPAGFGTDEVVAGARGGVLALLVVGVTTDAVETAGLATEAAGAGVDGVDVVAVVVAGVAGADAGAAAGVGAAALFVFHSDDSPPPVAAGVGVVAVEVEAAGVEVAAAVLLLPGTGLLGAANVLVGTAGAMVKPLTQLSQTFCFTVNEMCGRISRFFK